MAHEIEGFQGTWHRVMTLRYDAMQIKLSKVLTGAKDFLEAGDGEFTVANPRTMRNEVYATVHHAGNVTLYRQTER